MDRFLCIALLRLLRLPRQPLYVEGIPAAGFGTPPNAWPGKVRAADHHVVSNHAVHQLATRDFRRWAILVVDPVPAWMRPENRRHVDGIAGNHQLLVAGAQVESRVAWRMTGSRDKTNTGHHFVLAPDRKNVLPLRNDRLDPLSQRSTRLRQTVSQ